MQSANILTLPLVAAAYARAAALLLGLLLAAPAAHAQIPGGNESGDRFGGALAVGDFDGDGSDDLAIGVEEEGVDAAPEAGAVVVTYGNPDGIFTTVTDLWTQNTAGVLDTAEAFDRFGAAVTAGDFDGDGYDDLAIGAPYENVGTAGNAGLVHVLYGSAAGLTATGDQVWSQNDLTYTNAEADDHFGAALTAGDYNGDGYDDLVVASPQEDLVSVAEAGIVHVLFGSAAGLTATGNEAWRRESAGHGAPVAFDTFGHALASGDFNGNGRDDFAVGMVGYDAGGQANAGGVIAFYGLAGGMSPGNILWSQDAAGVIGVPELGDQFGFALASADFDVDGRDDLAVGVPFESDGALDDAGAVNVLYGGVGGLSATDNQVFTQNTAGVAGVSEAGDRFGYALAAGRMNIGSPADLAVGVEGEDHGAIVDAGAVVTIAGRIGTGLDPSVASEAWRQGRRGVHGDAEAGDRFGAALAIGRFDGNTDGELAVGVPDEDIDRGTDVGAVNIIYDGVYDGIDTEGDLLYQGYDLTFWAEAVDPPAPIVVAQGERVRFSATLRRLSVNHAGMDYWADAVFPNGTESGPYLGPGDVLVPGPGSGSATFSQRVSPSAPLGTYEYVIKVGSYPVEALATAVLVITVVAPGASGTAEGTLAARAAGSELFLDAAGPLAWADDSAETAPGTPAASSTTPEAPALHAARPNPARGAATLGFTLPEALPVRLAVYDALGREVAVVADGVYEPGTHRARFDGVDLPSGVYLVRLEAGETVQTQRLTLLR
ncbi:MAG: FG-GAP-like repeat-containing protein [Rubricoccaceae bacterium]|nr:FG-GAP-like repeat-containing protein [Rubricoccaceae bacterium]